MIVFAGSASNDKKISVFLALIAKPWTLFCCNIPSISLHLFISLFATFPKYFRTFSSHYLRYFPNISTPLYLITCDISQIFPQLFISLFARLEQPLIGGSRPPGKKSLLKEILERTGERKSAQNLASSYFLSRSSFFLAQLLLSTSFFDQGPCPSFFWSEYREL